MEELNRAHTTAVLRIVKLNNSIKVFTLDELHNRHFTDSFFPHVVLISKIDVL